MLSRQLDILFYYSAYHICILFRRECKNVYNFMTHAILNVYNLYDTSCLCMFRIFLPNNQKCWLELSVATIPPAPPEFRRNDARRPDVPISIRIGVGIRGEKWATSGQCVLCRGETIKPPLMDIRRGAHLSD